MNSNVPLILIIDDDETIHQLFQKIFQSEGFETNSAYNSLQGIILAKHLKPDLILLDVNMPGELGTVVCKKLQDHPDTNRIPIIMCSGTSKISTKIESFEAGAVDYIIKPFSAIELLARVKTHIRLRRALLAQAELQSLRLQGLKEAHEAIMTKPSDFPDARFGVYYKPLQELGGDFYNVQKIHEDIFDYVVADACGHDLQSSVVASALKSLLAQNSSPLVTLPELLQSLNKPLQSVLFEGKFVTMTIIRLNRKTRRAQIASAGGVPPLFVPRDSTKSQSIKISGDLLGGFDRVTFQSCELEIATGDRFYLVTDGLIEINVPDSQDWRESLEVLLTDVKNLSGSDIDECVRSVSQKAVCHSTPADDILLMGVEV
ncbi:MAG: SpoIIE family protein phosphatase [Candidatus Riflebacteria bacterium]|nr:SpoIIE family protein phosphatase [Candidatus Riflebacteria bacterium]